MNRVGLEAQSLGLHEWWSLEWSTSFVSTSTAPGIWRGFGTLANTLNELLVRDRAGTVVVEGVE